MLGMGMDTAASITDVERVPEERGAGGLLQIQSRPTEEDAVRMR